MDIGTSKTVFEEVKNVISFKKENKKSRVALTQLSLTLHYSRKNVLLTALHSYLIFILYGL